MFSTKPKYRPKIKVFRPDTKPTAKITDIYETLTGNRMRKSGDAYVCKCCFHDDKRPSLALYEATNTYFCFSCKASGDVISFVMRLNKVSYRDALFFLKQYER